MKKKCGRTVGKVLMVAGMFMTITITATQIATDAAVSWLIV